MLTLLAAAGIFLLLLFTLPLARAAEAPAVTPSPSFTAPASQPTILYDTTQLLAEHPELGDHRPGDATVLNELKLSPFTAPPPQYEGWETMSKQERRLALAQVAAEAVGKNFSHPLAKAIVGFREPIKSKNVRCRTRVNVKTYFMRCSMRF